MHRTQAARGTTLFVLLGPGLEAGVGPWLLTRTDVGGGGDWPAALRAAGVVLMVAGLAVLAGVLLRFVTHGAGTPSPAAPTTRLIVTGAYRHVRHPMYLATATVIAGEALAFAQPVLLGAAALYLAALGTFGRLVEEPRLARRFGPAYDAYRAAVPAWWPRLTPWRPPPA
ncbi:isoprenylcysteine carboxylmethyltransferase family protein [Baekduia soli]|uniref:Isoprenylcysteine carboxylmethyltransferase family protein n=1 Tax=Baekduia soli TaxID=496014 RepID=A0A5B8U7G2_9ACTN|nr:isoprenylcysteine carboxylmethyltransferase family protein [Baekduia soli]QEC49043.1 isoprenylcysteine carboxylmethyltransferase family protein [Baekduia soli]